MEDRHVNKKRIAQSIITLLSFFLINFGLWEVFVANGISTAWASFFVYAVLIVVVILIWNKKLLTEWKRFTSEMKDWKKFFFELVIWLVIAMALAYLLQYLVSGTAQTSNTETVGTMVDVIPPILSGIMISIFAPIIEELTFRESLIGFVDKKNKTLLLIMMVVSIIVFDCIHLFRWQEFFYYLPLSIALTVFYVKHNRNVYASIIMHALLNLPGVILMIING